MNSSSAKPSSLVRGPPGSHHHQMVLMNGGPSSAASNSINGILASKDDMFPKNKTFNYGARDSSSTRVPAD